MLKPFPTLLLGCLLLWSTLLRADETAVLKPIRILLVGDSTVASYAKPPADRPDMAGWGQMLPEFFNDQVTILNHAASGRSSKSFINEGRWEKALREKPDYVFIQFGHNDAPGKGEDRTTDPAGNYRDYLRRYVDETRTAGAIPILVTSVARRTFAGDKLVDSLGPHVAGMKAVAEEKKVPLIDLHRTSSELFQRLGDAGSADLSASADDRTHFSRKGASAMAWLVVEQIPEAEPRLAPWLKQSDVKPKQHH